jgi:Ca-activated chloride channel family protein
MEPSGSVPSTLLSGDPLEEATMRARIALGGVLMGLLALGCAGSKRQGGETRSPRAALSGPQRASDGDAPRREDTEDRTWIGGAAGSEFVLAGSHEEFLGVWIDLPEQHANAHVPTALTLAIDTSGSMNGEKIRHAREAAQRVIGELSDGDIVSIVTFADRGMVRLSPTTIDHHTRRLAMDVVAELAAEGGTAMHEGIAAAQSQFWNAPESHLVRRVVVISDGRATVGPTDTSTLGALAEAGMDRGIGVTSLGVGLDYDENTLNALAIRSSGRLYHLTESRELAGILEREIGLLQASTAAGAVAEIVPAPGVTILGVETARFGRDGERVHVPLGTMHGGQQRELLVRVRIDGHELGRRNLASLRLHYRDPAEGGLPRVQETIVSATITDSPGMVAEHRVPRTQTLIAMLESAHLAQLASSQANQGNLELASTRLQEAENHLRVNASRTKDKAAKKRLERQADRLGRAGADLSHAKASSGSKRKRSARKTALDLNDAAMDAAGY